MEGDIEGSGVDDIRLVEDEVPLVILPDDAPPLPDGISEPIKRGRGRPRKDGSPAQAHDRTPKPTRGELTDVDSPTGAKARVKERETRGLSLKGLAEYAIFPAFILNQMREMNYLSRKVSALKLFGADAKLNQQPDDELLVRILREQGKMYRNALEREDTKGAQSALDSLMKMQLGVMSRSESLLGMAIKIQSDAAKLQDKKKNGEMAYTEAELVAASGDGDE